MHRMTVLAALDSIRASAGPAATAGLPGDVVDRFASRDPRLGRAIDAARWRRTAMEASCGSLFRLSERDLCSRLQERILNFYGAAGVNPYVPLAAEGPWIVTSHGAVLHDSGGYGMLGLGHAPAAVLEAVAEPHVMANVMTPSFSQHRLTERLVREIGRSRGACPFDRFVFLNSGSDAVTFACRVSDIRARALTDPGGRRVGRTVKRLAVVDGFHGRTEGPARLSESCRAGYAKHLASFRGPDSLVFVPVNDIAALQKAFSDAEREGAFFEAMFVEPVMGEGAPGLALTPEYYDAARSLTADSGSFLVVDSIQAALRAQGCLSIVDYPGFEASRPPDIETYSKALNAGQYPLSVVALTSEAAATYVTGLYGNTMTANPRAMEAACAVLDAVTDDLRLNIRERGRDLRDGLEALSHEFPGAIERVVGTGLMVSAMLNPARYRVVGEDGFERFLRTNGIEMIHGGDTGLRFTPAFDITREEVDLIVSVVRRGLAELAPGA
ncbi:MAG TPA: aminotransferase class III-fold pyridoxal phosphate-dependent enzyme [Vicinamibacterales bacterium]|nr:aminotransferase class III-fold pyridoxal phosphate-dependent enzyme [Vicinamibacterales bacterium]